MDRNFAVIAALVSDFFAHQRVSPSMVTEIRFAGNGVVMWTESKRAVYHFGDLAGTGHSFALVEKAEMIRARALASKLAAR